MSSTRVDTTPVQGDIVRSSRFPYGGERDACEMLTAFASPLRVREVLSIALDAEYPLSLSYAAKWPRFDGGRNCGAPTRYCCARLCSRRHHSRIGRRRGRAHARCSSRSGGSVTMTVGFAVRVLFRRGRRYDDFVLYQRDAQIWEGVEAPSGGEFRRSGAAVLTQAGVFRAQGTCDD